MDILYLVDRLENLVTNSRRMPWINQIILKEADILTIIDQMRTSIPGEVKQARRIKQEKEHILAQAQAEANTILAHAREEAERKMSREGLLHTAEERAQEILQRASTQAQETIRVAEERTDQLQIEADSYASQTLQNLREHLLSLETEIERTVMSIERGIESLEGQSETQTANVGQHGKSEEESLARPRRASLAVDTMGGPTFPG